eukprot:CAMPEP_0170498732 /NCGR_PEP_ID=MMETSP0208-20121228/28786_1 /TAXON_ID=197538 /ORGANISM="Strombidium inclinatum, Strain S3" /LENGTH=116 /DNA_ID=CAMNT_0010775991 /DNA_START=474 /DNA_END=824 /DNA_ORIENTATION=+
MVDLKKDVLWNPDYFHDRVLEMSDSIEEPISFVPRMILLLVASYIIIYGTVFKGLKSTSQVVYFTVPLPCFLLAILMIKSVTLSGALQGLKELLRPKWENLWDIKVWEIAFTHGIF